jgi:hypothetical protein
MNRRDIAPEGSTEKQQKIGEPVLKCGEQAHPGAGGKPKALHKAPTL